MDLKKIDSYKTVKLLYTFIGSFILGFCIFELFELYKDKE